jgi:hypothetical protein
MKKEVTGIVVHDTRDMTSIFFGDRIIFALCSVGIEDERPIHVQSQNAEDESRSAPYCGSFPVPFLFFSI